MVQSKPALEHTINGKENEARSFPFATNAFLREHVAKHKIGDKENKMIQ